MIFNASEGHHMWTFITAKIWYRSMQHMRGQSDETSNYKRAPVTTRAITKTPACANKGETIFTPKFVALVGVLPVAVLPVPLALLRVVEALPTVEVAPVPLAVVEVPEAEDTTVLWDAPLKPATE
jgi:hypothetical protein